jgi:hypothetical protein
MGEKIRKALKLRFDKRLSLEFHRARITSDAGLLTKRALGEAVWRVMKGKYWLLRGSGVRRGLWDGDFWHCQPGCCGLQAGLGSGMA